MRVRILKQPNPRDIDAFGLSSFEVGAVYDIGPRMGELLTVCGYAAPEMRLRNEAGHPSRRKDDNQ